MLVPVDDLKPGMILDQNVLCKRTGKRLLSKGQKLTSLSIAVFVNRGELDQVEIREYEKKAVKEWNVQKMVDDVPDMFMAGSHKKLYDVLYKAIEQFGQNKTRYYWDRCRINIKKFIRTQNIHNYLYLVHCLPVMDKLPARIINTMIQAIILAKKFEKNEEDIYRICQAVLFSFIGLSMTDDESEAHIKYGFKLLRSLDLQAPNDVTEAVLQHHERTDGNGFPDQIKQVHLWAQFIGISDEYNRFVNWSILSNNQDEDRPYWSGKFAPELIKVFAESISNIGYLSFTTEDGKMGKIISARKFDKPVVMLESEIDFRGWQYAMLNNLKYKK